VIVFWFRFRYVFNSNTSLAMYLFCNSRIHVITLYSGHVCVYYASMLQCWHLVWILVRIDHPCLGVGCHTVPEVSSCSFCVLSSARCDLSFTCPLVVVSWLLSRPPKCHLCLDSLDPCILDPRPTLPSTHVCLYFRLLHPPSPLLDHLCHLVLPTLPH
jgi:hypothetical protein